MIDRDPKRVDLNELGATERGLTNDNQEQITSPEPFSDRKGRMHWGLVGQDNKQNLQIGIINVQVLFLRSFPEFNQLFPRDELNLIPEEKRKEAKEFILSKIGQRDSFESAIAFSARSRQTCPYFNGSYRNAIQLSFSPWGIDFDEIRGSQRSINIRRSLKAQNSLAEAEGNTKINALRDERKRVLWHLKDNSPEEDLRIGINNIQAIFLEAFPEFNELYSRQIEERISEDKRDEAKRFILERIGSIQKFLKIFGSSPVSSTSAPYFGCSFSVALEKAFAGWGIDFSSNQLMQFIFFQGPNGEAQTIGAVDQTEGIQNLKDLFKGTKNFSEVTPFVIYESHGSKKERNRFYVATINKKSIGFKVNQKMLNIFNQDRLVLVIPREDEKKLYQWLDFYEVDEGGNTNSGSLIHSSRIDANALKIDSKYWFGLERQLFLDYLSGKSEIGTGYLQEFSAILQKDRRIEIGIVNGKRIAIDIETPLCSSGQEIISKPKSEPSGDYTELEGYIHGEEGLIQVYSRRFFKGNLKLYKRRDSAIEAFSDWLKGVIPFEEAEPLTVVVNNKSNGISLANKFIKLGPQVKQGDEVIVIPRKDELYEWIDIKKKNKEGEDSLLSVGSYRLTREGEVRFNGRWSGPERQRWIDYLEEKQSFSTLDSLSETVGTGSSVSPFTWRRRGVHITLGKNIFTPGEQIRITPYLTQDNNLLIEVSSLQNSSSKRRYILDKHSLSVKALPDGFKQSEDFDSLPRVGRLTGSYEDDNKESWSPVGLLHIKLKVDGKTITKYCSSARKLKGFDRSGRLTELYSEADVIEILRANNIFKGGAEKSDESTSSDEANEYLHNLVYGEDKI